MRGRVEGYPGAYEELESPFAPTHAAQPCRCGREHAAEAEREQEAPVVGEAEPQLEEFGAPEATSSGEAAELEDEDRRPMLAEEPAAEEQASVDAFQEQQAAVGQARREWDARREIHVHFNFREAPSGFDAYVRLRPLYVARGPEFANPAEWIHRNITTVRFFGRPTPAHRELQAPLQRAEQALRALGCLPRLLPGGRGFWGLVPREMAAGGLSNHALGRALDFNPSENPHITDRDEIAVIRAVTCVPLNQQRSAAVLRWADQAYRRGFSPQHTAQLTQRLEQLRRQPNPNAATRREITRLQSALRRLTEFGRSGFFNLDQPLVDALTDAGFRWGGGWVNSKDFMHFELP